jgi:hypothetical protein
MGSRKQILPDNIDQSKNNEHTVYKIEIGYHKLCTTDKEAAFKVWQALADNFFELKDLNSGDYSGPRFNHRDPVNVKLAGEREKIWDSYEDAKRAHVAYSALKPQPGKEKADDSTS